jgi:uncharacterized membrane protein
MSTSGLLFLRLLHIVLGVFWVGSVTFVALLLLPSLRAVGPAGGAVMQQLTQVRRLPVWMMVAAILTVLSGLGLYWYDSAGLSSSTWLASGSGRTFGLGGVLAIVAVVIGMTVNNPAGKKLGALAAQLQAAGRPPSPEEAATIQRLQERLAKAAVTVAMLLLLATAAMALARYV